MLYIQEGVTLELLNVNLMSHSIRKCPAYYHLLLYALMNQCSFTRHGHLEEALSVRAKHALRWGTLVGITQKLPLHHQEES